MFRKLFFKRKAALPNTSFTNEFHAHLAQPAHIGGIALRPDVRNVPAMKTGKGIALGKIVRVRYTGPAARVSHGIVESTKQATTKGSLSGIKSPISAGDNR